MRRALSAVMLCLVLSVPAIAGEMEKYAFMGGLYTFQAPDGWIVQADDENSTGFILAPREGSPSMIMVTAPNPHASDAMKEFLGANIGALFKVFGEGELDEIHEDFLVGDQYEGAAATFDIMLGDEKGSGFGMAFNVSDYIVVVMAVAPDSDKEFLKYLEPIMDSFEVDEDRLEELEDELDAIGMKAIEELDELLEEE